MTYCLEILDKLVAWNNQLIKNNMMLNDMTNYANEDSDSDESDDSDQDSELDSSSSDSEDE
jgi:hypothetical protein